ncbi:hypothetical protein NL676_006812 [Syzygium grande]|nr:hypothetical protein NL676_006812 [Syzygium grande]
MPLRLEIKRKFIQRSERVKSVDLHPTEPWILASLYAGTVCIWDYQSQAQARIDIQSRKDMGYLYQRGSRRLVAVACDEGIPVVKIVC